MKNHLLLTIIVVLITYPVVPRTPSTVDVSAEEYAVYSAVIANMFETKSKLLVIQDATATDFTEDNSKQDEQYFRRMFPTLAEGVVKDYKVRNNEPVQLKDSFKLNVKHVLVEKQEVEKIFMKGGGWWEEFYKRYPDSGGLIILSRVGFNTAMNQAMIYIQHGCGGLCGTGHYVLLEKSTDQWKVVKRSMVWIS